MSFLKDEIRIRRSLYPYVRSNVKVRHVDTCPFRIEYLRKVYSISPRDIAQNNFPEVNINYVWPGMIFEKTISVFYASIMA